MKYNDLGLLVLRSCTSLLMIPHGWSKLSLFTSKMTTFPDPLGVTPQLSLALAVGAEFFCSLLVLLGIATRLASIPLLITMLVAGLIIHGSDPWAKQEFPLLYAIIYLALIFTGGGQYSLGGKVFKSKLFQ